MKSQHKIAIITIIIPLVVFIVFMWWHSKGRKWWEMFKQDRISSKPGVWDNISGDDIAKHYENRKKVGAWDGITPELEEKYPKEYRGITVGGKRTTRKTKIKQKNKK